MQKGTRTTPTVVYYLPSTYASDPTPCVPPCLYLWLGDEKLTNICLTKKSVFSTTLQRFGSVTFYPANTDQLIRIHNILLWIGIFLFPLVNFNNIMKKCIINAYGNRILELGRHSFYII